MKKGMRREKHVPADYVGKQSKSPEAIQRDAERRMRGGMSHASKKRK